MTGPRPELIEAAARWLYLNEDYEDGTTQPDWWDSEQPEVREALRLKAMSFLATVLANLTAADVPERVRQQIRAEALCEAADEVHTESRWQIEANLRGVNIGGSPVGRLTMIEGILRDRASDIDRFVQS
jgi:hypothetical protein